MCLRDRLRCEVSRCKTVSGAKINIYRCATSLFGGNQVSPLLEPGQSDPTAIESTPPKTRPRRGLFSHHFSFPFLTQLDPPKASQDDPFWRPKSTQLDPPKASQEEPFWRPESTQDLPKTRLETTLLQKHRFSKYEPRPRREHDFDPPGLPRRDQDRPKIAPRPS